MRIYGKRWDIEVLFKMAKHHLKLAKEIQCIDFDALISHIIIVFMHYMFVAYQCRIQMDNRTFGDLFYACCDEVKGISFIEALYRMIYWAWFSIDNFIMIFNTPSACGGELYLIFGSFLNRL